MNVHGILVGIKIAVNWIKSSIASESLCSSRCFTPSAHTARNSRANIVLLIIVITKIASLLLLGFI